MRAIKLTKGFVTWVDDEDFNFLSQWDWIVTINGSCNYALRHIMVNGRKTKIYMHRFLLGVIDPKILIDHKDFDGLNNQKGNLRKCNKSQNQSYQRKQKGTSSSVLGSKLA